MHKRLEIRVSKPRMLALVGLTGVMVGVSYSCTTLPDFVPRVVGWVGVLFFSLGFIVIPRQLFSAEPQVLVDERGIEDRRSKLGFVDWADVVSLSVGKIRRQKFLCVEVVEPKKYLDRLSTVGRLAARANRGLGFPEITIGFSGLSHTTDEVVAFIRQNCVSSTK